MEKKYEYEIYRELYEAKHLSDEGKDYFIKILGRV